VIFASRHSQVFFPRFLFGSMVFFLLIAVRGGFVLSRAVLPMLNARQITIIGLAVALATFTRVPGAWKPKQDFIAAAKFINAHREPGDAVVCPTYTFLPLHDYLELDCQRAGTRSELNRVEEGHSRTWFLYTFPVPFQSRYPDVWGKVQKDYTPVTKFRSTVGGGNIVIMLNSRRSPGNGNKKGGNGAP
jgi:hypothetical protein